MESNKRKRGRPIAENPLLHDCKCRFTDEQLKRLDDYSAKHGITRAQAIRKAVLIMLEKWQRETGPDSGTK